MIVAIKNICAGSGQVETSFYILTQIFFHPHSFSNLIFLKLTQQRLVLRITPTFFDNRFVCYCEEIVETIWHRKVFLHREVFSKISKVSFLGTTFKTSSDHSFSSFLRHTRINHDDLFERDIGFEMPMQSSRNYNFFQEETILVVSAKQLACRNSKMRRISQVVSTQNKTSSYVK